MYLDPADRQRMYEQVAKGPISDMELLLRRKGGKIITASISCHLVYNEAGQPVFLEGIVSDITERKEAEEALRKSEQMLERQNQELLAANQEMETLYKARNEHTKT